MKEILGKLVALYEQQPGYVHGYFLEHGDGSGVYGRIGVWEKHEDAERAAQTEHDFALRADLNRAVVEESHEEYSFVGTPSGT